jgi:hypothetical protein
MRAGTLAMKKQSAELLFELLYCSGQSRLRDIALLGRPREIQFVA